MAQEDELFLSLQKEFGGGDEEELIFDSLRQEFENKIPSTENFLQRAISQSSKTPFSAAQAATGLGVAGVTGFGASPQVEETFPAIGQAVGGVSGTIGGARFAGAPLRGAALGGTFGRRLGEQAKQGVKGLFRGQVPSLTEVEKGSQDAAIIESLFLPVGAFSQALPSGTFGKVLRGIPGKALGKIKDEIINSGLKIPKNEFLNPLRDIFEELSNKKGVDRTLRSAFQKQIKELEQLAKKKGDFFDPEDILLTTRSLDRDLANAGIFGKKIPAEFSEAKAVLKAREFTSKKAEEIAKRHDPKLGAAFIEAKRSFAKLAKKFPPGGKGLGKLVTDITRAGGIAQGARGNIPGLASGVAAAEVLEARASGGAFASLLQGIQSTAPAGITELLKRSRSSQAR